MDSKIRKAKIYSYFHGAGTVFQQFLIAAAALLVAIGFLATEASYNKTYKLREKAEELYSEAKVEEDEYLDYYWEYSYEFDVDLRQEAVILENDQYKTQKEEYNKALKEYNEALEKAEKAEEKYEERRGNSDAAAIPFIILAVPCALAGVIWSIYKKFVFKKKPCEEAYDEELQIKIEEAKEKALDKLNIVAEQIDRVDPVILNGVAAFSPAANASPIGKIAALFKGIVNAVISLKALVSFLILFGLYFLVGMLFTSIGIFFIAAIGAFALIGFFGYKVYKKYEVDMYVDEKSIDKLNKVASELVYKLGTDDNIRVSLPAITVYMFGDEQIYMYYQYLDIVTGKVYCEGVHEYFYEDIVGVVSSQETKKVYKRGGFLNLSLIPVEYLRESIEVVSSGCKHSEAYVVPMGNSLLDTSFVGMRNLIRQKKSNQI